MRPGYTRAVVRASLLALFVPAGLAGCPAADSPLDGGPSAWSELAALPGARLEAGVTALGQRLVVAGGFGPDLAITRSVAALDQVAGAWTALPDAPVALTHAQLAGVATTLYLIGGNEGADFVARGEVYALDTGVADAAWRPLTPMPAGLARGAAAVVVAPPHVFLLGGASTTTALASVLDYNVATDAWEVLPELPTPRSHAVGMRMADGTLIVAGGLASLSAAEPLAEVWALRPGATAWTPRAPMPTARGGCAAAVVLGRLVCAGGEAGTRALDDVEVYDPVQDTWITVEPMPMARAGTQGAAIGGRLLVPGGSGSLEFRPEATTLTFSLIEATSP